LPWRAAIERRTFRSLELQSTHEDLATLEVAFAHRPRREHLRVLRYSILLPEYPIRRRERYEVQADRDANDAAFTKALRALFAILAGWEQEDGTDAMTAHLHISLDAVYSPTDRYPPGVPHVPTGREQCSIPSQRGMRFWYSYLRLVEGVKLPRVRRVTSFSYHKPSSRRRQLAPHTLVQIADALPGLTSLSSRLDDSETAHPALRNILRSSLSDALEGWAVPVGLEHLHFQLTSPPMRNHAWQPPKMVMSDGRADPTSDALRKATLRMPELTSLHLGGVVDASLLWPRGEDHISRAALSLTPPFWQNLTTLRVEFGMMTPSGTWYFRAPASVVTPFPESASETAMPPGYKSAEPSTETTSIYRYITRPKPSGRRPERIFRLVPDEPVLLPLIEAFALACAQIPSLNAAALSTMQDVELCVDDERVPVTSNWGIYFAARGHRSLWGEELEDQGCMEEDLRVARLSFNTRQWQPTPEVLNLLRMMPTRGASLVEEHIDLWESRERPAEIAKWPQTIGMWRPPQ
jgi:hypothetical protein